MSGCDQSERRETKAKILMETEGEEGYKKWARMLNDSLGSRRASTGLMALGLAGVQSSASSTTVFPR